MKKYVAWLTINNNCNLACQWCYQGKIKGENIKIMSLEMAKKLLDILGEIHCKKVIILGGEPSIHPDFLDIISYSNLKTTVVTNGIKFADKLFAQSARDAGLNGISISLKAPSEKLYQQWTGACGLDDALSAAENAMAVGLDLQISVTVTEQVIENWQQLLEIIKQCGKYFTFSFERPVISGDNTSLPEAMHPKNTAHFIETEMYRSLSEMKANFAVNITFPQCHFSDGFVEKMNSTGNAISGCQLISNEGIIFDPQGQVIPCNHLSDHAIGAFGENFTTGNEFINWRESLAIKKFFQSLANPPDQRCSDCSNWITCGGGCRMFWLHSNAEALLPKSASYGCQKGGYHERRVSSP